MTKISRSDWIFDRHRFKAYRITSKLSRKEMGSKLSVSERTVKAWELGENIPSTRKVTEIANCLRIPEFEIAASKEECLQYVMNRHQEMMSVYQLVRARINEELGNVGQEFLNDIVNDDWKTIFPLISREAFEELVKSGKLGELIFHLYAPVMNRVDEKVESILNEIECSKGENNNSISV